MDNYFAKLNAVDVSKWVEKKNGLSYVSWANAWSEVKKLHPDAVYTVYENANGWNYHTDGRTCWVKTGMTVQGIEHIEYLPVMDFRNASITADKVTSFDVNKAIQRSLTKAAARHGLGLYIYAGEDLPEGADTAPSKPIEQASKPVHISAAPSAADLQAMKIQRMKMIASDVQKYTKSKDRATIREGIEAAEAWMRVNNLYGGKEYEVMTTDEFAAYLKGLNSFYTKADKGEAVAV